MATVIVTSGIPPQTVMAVSGSSGTALGNYVISPPVVTVAPTQTTATPATVTVIPACRVDINERIYAPKVGYPVRRLNTQGVVIALMLGTPGRTQPGTGTIGTMRVPTKNTEEHYPFVAPLLDGV